MDFIQEQQLNIVVAFIGICAAIIILLMFTKALTKKRRRVLVMIELSALLLLFFDRLAYAYSGDASRAGYVMVRLSNFCVYFMTSAIVFAFNAYLIDLLRNEGKMTRIPRRIKVSGVVSAVWMLMAIVAHFTGLYYTFDQQNRYRRAPGFAVSYVGPLVTMLVQLSVVYKYRKLFDKWIYRSLLVFMISPVVAAVIQVFAYGLSITNMVVGAGAMFLYVFAHLHINEEIEKAHKLEIKYLQDEKSSIRQLFDQTVNAFVNAIDARYPHTQGHSQRVAKYAKRIAELDGMSPEKSEEVYYAALVHDIGRVWISDEIVKKGKSLSEEELEKLKHLPVIGSQILSSIEAFPDLGVGAHYYRERFDGTGYPDALSGEEIPETARIVTVANAYDLMASEADMNPPMTKELVREELLKESGRQLDPKYTRLVLSIMDSEEMDPATGTDKGLAAVWDNEFICGSFRDHVTSGIAVTEEAVKIEMLVEPEIFNEGDFSSQAIVLFDSFDGRVHDSFREIEAYRYTEFGEIWFDGHFVCTAATDIEASVEKKSEGSEDGFREDGNITYTITAFRRKDHLKIEIDSAHQTVSVIVALPDSSMFAYIGLTGEHCHVSDITIEKLDLVEEEDIPRIADPISYINRLESDLPNVQIDGRRTASTESVPLKDGLRIEFHTMSLPSANLIWHCPYVILFASDDGTVGGSGYREFALIRLNGETKDTDEIAQNVINVDTDEDFVSWDKWKERNLKGYESRLYFRKSGNKITTITRNGGISIENVTTIIDGTKEIYVALTGDMCALTDIRIR